MYLLRKLYEEKTWVRTPIKDQVCHFYGYTANDLALPIDLTAKFVLKFSINGEPLDCQITGYDSENTFIRVHTQNTGDLLTLTLEKK